MKQKKTFFKDELPLSIFVGVLGGYTASVAYHYATAPNMSKTIDLAMSSLFHPSVAIIASVYVLWDTYRYLGGKMNFGENGDSDIIIDSKGNKIIKRFDARLKKLPEKLELYTVNKEGEKIYDALYKYDKKNGVAVFNNRNNVIDFGKYSDQEDFVNIKEYLGIDGNDYFTTQRKTHNSVELTFKDPFGKIPFDPKLLKKNHNLVGYTIKREYYYISDQKLSHSIFIGTTGSGKSTHINGNLISTFYNHKNYEVIYLLDLKGGVEMMIYDNLLNGKVKVGKSIKDFCVMVETVYAEMVKREEECMRMGLRASPRKQWYILCDEINQWMITLSSVKGNTPMKKYFLTIEEKLSKIMVKSRALRLFLCFYGQKATADFLPIIVREMCISGGLLKTSGFYDAIISTEKMKELGYNPDNFAIGTLMFKDGTETHGTGDRYTFMKSIYVKTSDIVSILGDEDKATIISMMWGQKLLFEKLGLMNNSEKAMDMYQEIVEYFQDKSNQQFINQKLVDGYLVRNNIPI